jgi:MioC protein
VSAREDTRAGDVLDFSHADPRVAILVATETGTARQAADHIADALGGVGFQPAVYDLSEIAPADVAYEPQVIAVAATHGEGDPCAGAEPFYDALRSDPPDLSAVAFGVVALGDQTYEHFARAGFTLRDLLAGAGAVEVADVHTIDRGLRLSQIDEVEAWALGCAQGFSRAFAPDE